MNNKNITSYFLNGFLLVLLLFFSVQTRVKAEVSAQKLSGDVKNKSDAKCIYKMLNEIRKSQLIQNFHYDENAVKAGEKLTFWNYPELSLDSGYKSADANGITFGIELRQAIPWFGKKDSYLKTIQSSRDVINVQRKLAENKVFARVLLLFYELHKHKIIEEHYSERTRRYTLVERYLQSRPFASPKQRVERSMVRSHLILLKKEFNRIKQNRLNILRDLKKINPETDWQCLGNLDWDKILSDKNLDKILAYKNFSASLQLKILKKSIKKLQSAKMLSQSLSRPDPALKAYYNQEPGSPQDRYFGAGISYPLALWKKNTAKIARLNIEIKKLESIYKNFLHKMKVLYSVYREKFVNHQQNIKLFSIEQIRKNELEIDNIEREFIKGRINLLDFIGFDEQLHEIHHQRLQQRFYYLNEILQYLLLIADDKTMLEVFDVN